MYQCRRCRRQVSLRGISILTSRTRRHHQTPIKLSRSRNADGRQQRADVTTVGGYSLRVPVHTAPPLTLPPFHSHTQSAFHFRLDVITWHPGNGAAKKRPFAVFGHDGYVANASATRALSRAAAEEGRCSDDEAPANEVALNISLFLNYDGSG